MKGTEFRNGFGRGMSGTAAAMPPSWQSVSGRQRLERNLDGCNVRLERSDVRALCCNGRLERGDVRVHAEKRAEAEPGSGNENRDDPGADCGQPAQPDPLYRNVASQLGNVGLRRDAGEDSGGVRSDRLGISFGNAVLGEAFGLGEGVKGNVGGHDRRSFSAALINLATFGVNFQSVMRRALPAALAALLALSGPALAQTTPGGTLGIDCEKPRRNMEGKLLLGDDGGQRALCEADRATALNYAAVVRETRDRLRAALAVLPPPVWDDLVDHLRTDDAIGTWAYSDAGVMSRLGNLSAAAPPGNPREVATSARAHGLAQHWDGGILEGSGVGAAWHGLVRARACGFGPGNAILPGARILVWLDPGAVRDRWTPTMVQRTARAWLASQSDRFIAVDRIPDVVTATRELSRADGSVRQISGNAAVQACFATVPEGALAMMATLWRSTDVGRRTVGCDVAGQVGLRRLVWARQNGVFIVPENALQADGSDHPQRGEPLLGQDPALPLVTAEPAAILPAPQPGEFLVATTCRAPRTVDAVRVEDCDAIISNHAIAAHAHAAAHGMDPADSHGLERHAHAQGAHVVRVRFREVQNDPTDPLRIVLVPVGPDPLDPANALGVIAPPGPHPIWERTTLFCEGELPARFVNEIPEIPTWDECREPADCDGWVYPDCSGQWGGRFGQGQRVGWRQIESYPPGWPVDEVEVRRIDDDCFNPVPQADSESRTGSACEVVATTSTSSTGTVNFSETVSVPSTRQIPDPDWVAPSPCGLPWDPLSGDPDPNHADCGETAPMITENYLDTQTVSQSYTDTDSNAGACNCPAGWSGSITQERDFEWHNRDWAVPVRHPGRAQWSVGQVAGFYDGTATTDALNNPIGWLPVLSTDPPDPPGMPAFIRLISLTADWHEESNTCTPPAPSSGSDGDPDSPWGYRSYLDGQVYERPAADGTSRGEQTRPDNHGAAPSAEPGEYDYSGF